MLLPSAIRRAGELIKHCDVLSSSRAGYDQLLAPPQSQEAHESYNCGFIQDIEATIAAQLKILWIEDYPTCLGNGRNNAVSVFEVTGSICVFIIRLKILNICHIGEKYSKYLNLVNKNIWME